jgi:hypothetical protein
VGTHPYHGWTTPRVERTHALQWEEERWHADVLQVLGENLLLGKLDVPQETQGQMQLGFRHPSQSRQVRIEIAESRLAVGRQLNP